MPKHAGGRPTEYDPSFIHEVDEYLKKEQDEWEEFHKVRGQRSDSYEKIITVHLPTRYGFAKFIGVTRQTVDNWSGIYPEFFDALGKIDEEQKNRLLENGLAGKYNPVIAKLVLSSNHGMAEKEDKNVNVKGDDIVGAILAALNK